eukprot:s3891_g9.t1
MGIPVFSMSLDLNVMKLANKTVRNALLDEWKKGRGKPEYGGVKFQPDAPSVPEECQVPDMAICKAFDKKHGVSDPVVAAASAQPGNGESEVSVPAAADAWARIFPDAPKTIESLEKKFPQIAATFPLACGGGLVCFVCEGPEFYVGAPSSAGTCPSDQVLLGHGGGVWLLDGRATKAIQDTATIGLSISVFFWCMCVCLVLSRLATFKYCLHTVFAGDWRQGARLQLHLRSAQMRP